MSISYKQLQVAVDVKCPFFSHINSGKGKTGYSITCEGIEDAEFNTTRFKTSVGRSNHLEKYCNYYPNACPLCKVLEDKYK